MQYLTRKYHIQPSTVEFNECMRLCIANKDLYNKCISYINDFNKIHNSLKDENGWIFTLTNLYRKFKTSDLYKFDKNGNKLNSKIMKSPFKICHHSFSSYFDAIKEWKRNPSKFKSVPKLPGLKRDNQQLTVIVSNQAYSIKGNILKVSMTDIKINISDLIKLGYTKSDLGELKITPTTYGYSVSLLYKKELPELKQMKFDSNIAYWFKQFGFNSI